MEKDTLEFVLEMVLDERDNQIEKGFTRAHDDEHDDESIAAAAAYYIAPDHNKNKWPWDEKYNKKGDDSRLEDLAKGVAMGLAEMERIVRGIDGAGK